MVGQTVGRFRLVRLLGEGGSSSVFLGERTGDFQQTAAVKLLREGVPDAETLLRFRAERRVLAALQHPGIVQLIDGGVTESGLPYLVMEYVEGTPLDQYCKQRNLPPGERIQLVIQVLEAVEYAHQHFVAHCDLKFSNILVTAEGRPRLLDFGITKMPGPSRAGGEATREGARPFTLEFASPEQLAGQKLTTATDLYSIGVILYALLTGSLPFESLKDQPLALWRATLSAEPEPPGHRLRQLRGDLDAVLLKALAKEPEHRYSSAAQFAADLRNFLASRPVEARRGSRRYRLGKFVKRNRAAVIAASVLILALLAGAAGAVTEGIRAQRSRAAAEARLDDARKLTNSLLVEFYAAAQKLDGSEGARQSLVRWSSETLENLARRAGDDAAVKLELANTYLQLGKLQEGTEAIASFDRGLRLLDPAASPQALAARTRLLEARRQAAFQ